MGEKRKPAFFVDPIIDPLMIPRESSICFVGVVIEIQRSADDVKFGIDVYPLLRTKVVTLDKRLFGAGQSFAEYCRSQVRSEDESCLVQRRAKGNQHSGSGYDLQSGIYIQLLVDHSIQGVVRQYRTE